MLSFRFTLLSAALGLGLFLGMLLFLELGRRLGLRQAGKFGTAARAGVGVVDSSIYALTALLLGFAFNGAAARYDQRRQLIVQEVSAIGTAWTRIDALPPERQAGVRADFRRYVDAVVASYATPRVSSRSEALRETAEVTRAQANVWARAVADSIAPSGAKARRLLLPARNEMCDAGEKERLARRIHPPVVIYAMLGVAALAAALFAGYSMANATTRNWLYTLGVAAAISRTTYVIIELEYPRLGWVRLDAMDRTLTELRETIN